MREGPLPPLPKSVEKTSRGLGIRWQILLSLALLLLLSFIPLHFAVARLTRATFQAWRSPSGYQGSLDKGARGSFDVLQPLADGDPAAPLLHLIGLYTVLFALALLVFAYIALTRLIVRPLDQLTHAARRIADGARTFDGIRRGPAELSVLGASLSEMTAKLRHDEERMREQILELEHGAQRLREAQDRLVRSERLASVGRLSAGLAHEIGNPIAAMSGLLDLLLEGGLTPNEERDFLRRIRGETERVHRILRDLLDFARPPAALPESNVPGNLEAAVRDVQSLVQPQKRFRAVSLLFDIPAGLPEVTLSHEKLMQVLLNLLLNAADATQLSSSDSGEGGRVEVLAELHSDVVRLRVQDNGKGIDPSVRPRLFEPFATTKEVGEGTGLGLAVCRGLVEASGGTISVDDSFTGGARFVVELPIARERP